MTPTPPAWPLASEHFLDSDEGRPLRSRKILNFDALVRHGMVEPKDVEFFPYADDPMQALALLQRALPTHLPEGSPHFAHSKDRER
jgi:hypothetical protein